MQRALDFIRLFNDVDDYLRRMVSADREYSFFRVVDHASEVNRAVYAHRDQLKGYARLRNAIVHYRNYPPEVVAEPSEEALLEFARAVEDVKAPSPLLAIASKEVQVFSPTSGLVAALAYMMENDFSQIVVGLDDSLRLLTTEGIARWLERRAEEGVVNVEAAILPDVLEHEKLPNVVFADRTQSVYDGRALFSQGLARARERIFAVIITESGSDSEVPLGVVTPWDMMELAPELGQGPADRQRHPASVDATLTPGRQPVRDTAIGR